MPELSFERADWGYSPSNQTFFRLSRDESRIWIDDFRMRVRHRCDRLYEGFGNKLGLPIFSDCRRAGGERNQLQGPCLWRLCRRAIDEGGQRTGRFDFG